MRTYRFLLVWVLLLACVLCASAQAQGKKWALLVGVQDYKSPDINRLDFAVKDVTSVAEALKTRLGYAPENVRLMTSAITDENDPNCPTNLNVFDALDGLKDDVGPDDTFLFYFSGHGFSKDGQNFLGTINARPTSAESLQLTAISMPMLQQKMKQLKARQVIFMVDACRNDPEKDKGAGDNKLTEEFSKSLIVAARTPGARGSAVLFACSEGQRAFEDPSKLQSVFTYYLLEALEGKGSGSNGPLTMQEVADYVQKQVGLWSKEHHKQQTPELLPAEAPRLVLADKIIGPGAPVAPDTGGSVTDLDTKAQISITSDPPGAKVYLDGVEQAGVLTPATIEIDLGLEKTRQVEVGIQQAGYKPVVKSVQLQRGKLTPIPSITLIPLPNSPTHPVGGGGAQVKTKINSKDGAEMIFIPAGDFLMGNTEEEVNALLKTNTSFTRDLFSDAIPQHKVYLDGYYIYKNDVTVGMYKRFCQETGRQMPPEPEYPAGNHFNPNWSKEDHPIVDVTWDDAKAYCDWAGVSLPTEAQWEKAARGMDGRQFPWGNDFEGSRLQHSTSTLGDAGGTVPVGSFPSGASPFGVLDMAGNVWNWCSDWYDANYYQNAPLRNPGGPASGQYRVLRGGSWYILDPGDFRSANRDRDAPSLRDFSLGFRGASGL